VLHEKTAIKTKLTSTSTASTAAAAAAAAANIRHNIIILF